MSTSLPRGNYLFGVRAVRTTYGGRTMAMLTRSRLFTQAGVSSTVLTFDSYDGYAREEAELRRTGRLGDDVRLLNIYDYYRHHDWPETGQSGESLPELSGDAPEAEVYPDGTPWRLTHHGEETFHDFQRADGSVFLRAPADLVNRPDKGAGGVLAVDRNGQVVRTFDDASQWFQDWVLHLRGAREQPTFLMLEDFFLSHLLSPFEAPDVHEILSVHVPHTNTPRRWDSSLNRKAASAFNRLADVDAVVLLTDRQRDDVRARYGPRNHLFTIPNPIEVPDPPTPVPPRDPARFMVIARLERGKRVEQTIDAFAAVHARLPQARLDIAGDGPERDRLQRHIDASGLSGVVTMLGHDPVARERLWSVSGLVLTTAYEAFPLVVLEAMSRACPVVSYDVKYGPREMLEDCGLIVKDEDVRGITRAMLQLVEDPDLVARLGRNGRKAAERYAPDRVLAQWGDVLEQAVRMRPERVSVRDQGLTVRTVELQPSSSPTADPGPDPGYDEEQLVVEVDLNVGLEGPEGWERDLVIGMEAVRIDTGERRSVPCEVDHLGSSTHRVRANVPVRDLCESGAAVRDFRFRVSFTCRNAGWANYITRADRKAPVQELFHDGYGRLTLRAGNFSSR